MGNCPSHLVKAALELDTEDSEALEVLEALAALEKCTGWLSSTHHRQWLSSP